MSYDPERITFFAKTDARGKNVPFGIKAKDRTKHVYVIGKTGMGKSTLLENMAVQDIKNGEGFAFIDPHGQTAETLLDYIPEERIKDVLYFAPHDTDHPVSFNIMEDVGADKRHLVVSGLMSVFKKIWVDAWSARMEYILSNTLLALLEYPDSTLLGVNRMLSDKAYRKKVVDNISDPSVKSFWVDEFAKYNERYMQEAGDAIKNKIGQFTANPIIRNIVGQPKSSFDIRTIMDEKKILIMNLSKGLIGETNANLLGSMLTTRIYLAAMSRADLSPMEMQQMPNFYFYVDEFQSFANATFANILSEARKYKLNLTIAHQYIEQMEEDVRNAVFGNVGTTIAFRVGPFDAEILETIFSPKFLAVDICNLGFAQVYLTLMIDGIGSAPFSAVTLPPIQHQGTSFKDMIIAESRKQFGKTRVAVEEAIVVWHGNGSDVETSKDSKSKKETETLASKSPRLETNNPDHDRNSSTSATSPKIQASDNIIKPRPVDTQVKISPTTKEEKLPAKSRDVDKLVSAPSPVIHAVAVGETAKRDSSSRKVSSSNNKKTSQPSEHRPALSKKPETQSSQPGKNSRSLDELRSVLKSMANQEVKTKKPDSENTPTSGEIKANSVVSEGGGDLRSILAGVVGQVIPNSQAETPLSKIKTPNIEKVMETERPAPITPVIMTTNQSPVVEENNKLDPKHLERLMRVGVNDKTPLK